MSYEKIDGAYNVNLTVPQGTKAVLYVPADAVVNVNSKPFYQNGKYINDTTSADVEVVEITAVNG